MIRKSEIGQAFILVLIVLAIGALLVVPSLRLTGTALMNSPIVERQIKGLYAADAAQEYILWKLAYGGLAADLMESYNPEGTDPSVHYDFDVCGVPVGVTVIMRATEGQGGITLATDDKIKPTKTVTPSSVPGKDWYDYTYTISLEQLSTDNSVGLDAVYDVLPNGLVSGGYHDDSSELSLDGGSTWLPIPDPYIDPTNNTYLKWPLDYDWDPVVVNPFTSDGSDGFYGMHDFEVRQEKLIRFTINGRLNDDQVHCNWAVLKMEDGTNTLSGPQAPVTVGNPDIPGECQDSEVIIVEKIAVPNVIPPGVATPIVYTISITNRYTSTVSIEEIRDYLPPDFEYTELMSSEMVDPEGQSEEIQILELDPLPLDPDDPERYNPENDISELTINGITRLQLRWRTPKFPSANDISIASNYTLNLTFRALATKDVSGSYYNEILVFLRETGITNQGFTAAGITAADYRVNYSWNTGTVIVPAYDSSSEAEGITIDANMALILGGITITSWGVN